MTAIDRILTPQLQSHPRNNKNLLVFGKKSGK